MILDIDVGNTRCKWRVRDGDDGVVQQGMCLSDRWRDDLYFDNLTLSRVRIASVHGAVDVELTGFFRSSYSLEPEFARVVDGVDGFHCGYTDPGKLGIDRWSAVLACRRFVASEALVVDAGSALTIDVLVGNSHRGGYIVPGLRLMGCALGAGTWGVKPEGHPDPRCSPGAETSTAVYNGILTAMVGAVVGAADEAGLDKVVITGGDAPLVKKYIPSWLSVVEKPDLVLDGLAVILP